MANDARPSSDRTPANRLLAQLSAREQPRWWKDLEYVPLTLRQVLYDIDAPVEHVYFVEEGVASIVSAGLDGVAVETGTVGREGMVGLPVFLEATSTSSQAFCQIPGGAYRMPAAAFAEALRSDARLRTAIARYTQAFLSQSAQGSACNRLHSARQRCARWLLESHDRVTGDTLRLTHEYLSQMLGVRRATVSEVAAQLQWERLIKYEYGKITVLDRAGLERVACECYAIVQREFQRLVDGRDVPSLFAARPTAQAGKTTLEEPGSDGEPTVGSSAGGESASS